jgi:hypothetical protein
MQRTNSLLILLALAGTASARAQDLLPAKQPAPPPHMEDVKTPPLAYPKEESSARRLPATEPTSNPRRERVEAAAGAVRHELPFPMFDVDEHGTHWVRGATYKASFGPFGSTYVPFLGSRAPRNFPVTMRIASITAGGVPIGFDADVPATRDGATISFDHESVVEQYLIERNGMEQRFVFDTLPARGEIVVTLGVETELTGRTTADGLRFENERGHATYGKALAFDAGGRSCPVEERLENGRIELVVPAAFVATADLPLVIDPYQGTFVVDTDNDDDSNPDVAFVTGAPAALVLRELAFSAVDHDVFAEKYIDQVYQGVATVDASIVDWRNTRVAGNELSGTFLCVAEAGTSPNRIIRGRSVDASSLATGAQFTISGAETGDKHGPDVGGDPVLAPPTYFCVVWQRDYSATDTDIHGRLVTSSGTATSGSVIFVDDSAGTLDSRPSISKTDGNAPFATQNWSVVWQHEASPTDDDVNGARIRWDGSITSPTFNVAGTAANERFPTASEPLDDVGQPRQWLAVYTLDADLRFRAWSGTSVVDTLDLAAGTLQTFSAPDVTTDGRLWQVAFTDRFNVFPNPDTDVRAATLSTAGGSLSFAEASTPIAASSSEVETRPRIASTLGAANPYRSYVAYDRSSATTGLDVLVGVYDSPVNAGGFAYCFGTNTACPCGNGGSGSGGCASSVNPNGAVLSSAGIWAVSGDAAYLTATGMPSTASALYFQGTGQSANGTPFGDGLRCATGAIIRLATKTSVGGSSHFPAVGDPTLHVKGAIPAAGGWRYYQAWYRNVAVFCTASTFNLTNGVALLWAP